MINEKSENTKILIIALAVITALIIVLVGTHFFFLYKVKHTFDNNSLKLQNYEVFARLNGELACESVGYIKFDCTGGSGSIYLNEFSQNDAFAEFKNIVISTSFTNIKSIHVFIDDDDFMQNEEKELFFPVKFDFENSGDDIFKASLDGAFGVFEMNGAGDVVTLSFRNDDFRGYFNKIFTILGGNEEQTPEEFTQSVINELEYYKQMQDTSIHYMQTLDAVQNLLSGNSKGIKMEFYIKTKEQDAINNALQMMIISQTVNTDVFDIKISNL
ncbi:MAG: hypothetical protein LBI78_04975 [Campylobacteraceae bacterium]|jgi:hypothetical protein|nr:hypothetical protein [Campylobacteraceae bacterium]